MPERIIPTDATWWPEYGWEHIQRYAFAKEYCRGSSVLDFGCGVGYGSEILGRGGQTHVFGVDVDPQIIAQAQCRPHPDNVQFFTDLNAAAASCPTGFDAVAMFEVIEHLPRPAEVLEQIADVLKRGGHLVISAPNRFRFTGAMVPIANEFHLSEPTYEQFHAWLAPRFDVIVEYEQSDLSLGPYDRIVETLQQSWVLRAERALRRALGRDRRSPTYRELLVRKTDIFPLIAERQAVCRQFLFVARKR